ncbi:BTAD domain-containing putative transcriptional regulator [Actinoplanes oblitus]|uniref:BTAD domain-containing putative transcriptional regulator n=1 Tax=Actinoplanes oblitus TaxID=3040509 RepID=A0ABY8WGY9_9ACTN|nr:BTAD domain-containing putative transcriptional regulator [Actinoplanes oblitus]WIM94995.1 BTAD domain-containing putative transcriptional regulator [Actinoplanes oblitus]
MRGCHGPRVRLQVLGPLLGWRDDEQVSLGPLRQQVVLAVLALSANRPTGRAELIEAVWGESTPAYAVNLVQKYVSGLRRVLEPVRPGHHPSQVLSWTDAGYLLSLPHGALDLEEFDRGVARARAAVAEGDLKAASRSLHAALELWRGPALNGLSSPLLDAERNRLAERRISALEERIEIDLALGDRRDLAEEAGRLVAEHPLRERLRALLMRALYQQGRQGEALAAFRAARDHLRSELGVEPAAELQALHKRILNGDPDLLAPGPWPPPAPAPVSPRPDQLPLRPAQPAPRPAQLPHGLPEFVGRRAELDRLDALAASGQSVMIAAITGTAGVGKTSLAVQWAHRISDRFPDGQLYVNLHGFEPSGSLARPGEVLRGFLDALGVGAQQIAGTVDELAARYRSLLAGRRLLLVLDNARNTEQVHPLLPGTPGCMVVVTSRSRLAGLVAAGAVPVTVDLPTAEEAAELLSRRIGPERVATEPQAAAAVVAACARLPLALALVASRAAPHPQYRLSALAAELRPARADVLDAFIGETESTDARAVLSWSYHQLSDPAARLFRLLGLHPGPDITAPAAASLAGVPARQARRMLAELSGAHMLEEHTPGRFAFHDLLRAYAAEQVEEEESATERQAATERLLDHYLHSAHAADRTLYPYRTPIIVGPPGPAATVLAFASPDEALAWFTAEQPVLLNAIAHATGAGFTAYTSLLTWTVTAFLNYQGQFHSWARCLRAALLASRQLGDRAGVAQAHQLLNIACRHLGLIAEADTHAGRALQLYDQLGDGSRQGRLLLDIARGLEHRGEYEQALRRATRALCQFHDAGDRMGKADALSWVGWYYSRLGDHDAAMRHCHDALRLHREGNWPGQADTWAILGNAHHHLGHYDEALNSYAQALARWGELGDRYEVAITLQRLGDTQEAAGRLDRARSRWQQARTILEELGHPDAALLQARLDAHGAVGAANER